MIKDTEEITLIQSSYLPKKGDILPEVLDCLYMLEKACKQIKLAYPSEYVSFENTGRCYLVAGGFVRDLVSP